MPDHDTIAAIATASGRSGIGVVRVSGKMLAPFAAALTGKTPAPRVAALSTFRASDGSPIDQGITLYFRAPHSYTGEDVLELQGHGGPVVLQWLLKRCVELGARVAAPGEFTKRAFLNGKLDLAQAESVADLIDASTEAAARSAILSLTGYFSEQIQILNSKCIELRALLEAMLDFPEEEIDNMTKQGVEARLADLRTQLLRVLAASEQGSLLREGVHIVLAGQPNVGKSSLLNRLAGDEIAIVTDIPGTTRDAIRQTINLEGVPAHIIDTAGLRETNDPVERLGVARTWAAIEKADLVLLIIDARIGDTAADRAILAKLPQGMVCLRVLNKVDLTQQPVARMESPATVWLSAKTGAGVDMLKTAMLDIVGWHGGDQGIFLARARHLDALRTAHKHLEQATTEIGRPELCAEDLRLAHEALGAITGEYTSDDLLGEIFSRFCIGK